MISSCNKRKINQEMFYNGKDKIEITYEYKCLGIGFYSHCHFEPSSKRQRIASMKDLMGTLRKEGVDLRFDKSLDGRVRNHHCIVCNNLFCKNKFV